MTMFYLPTEANDIKAQREEREPGIDLVKCKDGLWRTVEEKKSFDKAHIDIPSQITLDVASA